MNKILVPMIARHDIEESIPAMGIGCKKGDIFMFDPDNEIHVALYDSNMFKEVPNKNCIFTCMYVGGFQLGDERYDYKEIVDISNTSEEVIRNLYMIGYLKKELVKKTSDSKKSVKNKKVSETYTKLAKELGKSSKEFKKEVFELTGIEIKDMRKNIPAKEKKKIIEALNK